MAVFNAKASNSTDLYGTPPYATELLLPYLQTNSFRTIWEPCNGFGAITSVLLDHDFDVVATDIADGIDALKQTPPGWSLVDAVVTNPPYSLKSQFLRRCYELTKPFALLMPCDLVNKERTDLMARYGVQLIVPNKRIRFLRFDGGVAVEAPSPNMGSCWFTWQLNLPQDIVFVSLPQTRIQVTEPHSGAS